MPDRTGQQLGYYHLIKRASEDAFTETYLGVHTQTGTQVTLKVAKYPLTQASLVRFLAEAARLTRLNHPNIVRILAYGESNAIVYLAQNITAQGTFRQIFRDGQQIELSLVLRAVQQIASALQYIHGQGIMHGDLRPENLLPRPQQSILLTNFSLPGLRTNQLGSGITPYIAPEQLRGEIRPASDQYALGVMTYEWLSGAPPSANNRNSQPLSVLVEQVSTDLEQVIMRALEQDWRARFETIRDFALALDQASTSTFVSQTPIPLPPSFGLAMPQTVSASNSQAASDYFPARSGSGVPPAPSESFGASSFGEASGPSVSYPIPPIQYPIYPSPPVATPAPAYSYPPIQTTPAVIIPVSIESAKKPIYFPLTRKAPVYMQFFGMLLYSSFTALCIMGISLYLVRSYNPGSTTGIYTSTDGSTNSLAIVLTVILGLLIVPACSLFCGVFFGSWRGLLVSLASSAGGIFITQLSYTQFWQFSLPQSIILLVPLPLTALIVGLIYDHRKFTSWGKSLLTIMLGWAIIIGWLAILIGFEELNASSAMLTTSSSSVDLGATIVILACGSLLLTIVLSLPTAAIEGSVHSIIASTLSKDSSSS